MPDDEVILKGYLVPRLNRHPIEPRREQWAPAQEIA